MRGSIRGLAISVLALAAVAPLACSPDAPAPDEQDRSDGERLPDTPEPTRTPSPSPTSRATEDSVRDGEEPYEDIDLESGDCIPEGSCGPYAAPETDDEFNAVEKCNPDHGYGACVLDTKPMGGGEVIVGSSGDDVLEGTSKASVICGMGGNDIIVGGEGENLMWGGPGNDYIS